MKEERFIRIQEEMKKQGINQIIITSAPDIFYVTGLSIESGERMIALYLSREGVKKLIINELFKDNCKIEGIESITYKDTDNPINILYSIVKKGEKLGVDKNWPAHFLLELMEKDRTIEFINSSIIVDGVRMIKDSSERELLRKASSVVDKVMEDLIGSLYEGITERKACEILKEIFNKYGTYEYSFSPIVAFGKNGADPHHDTDDSKLKIGDSVVIDIGGKTNDYCSDITRTVFFKEATKKNKEVYNIVLDANETAIKKVKPGVRFKDIDKTARDVIENAGYGEYFTHRTGHSIGIEDHENPSVASNNEMEVREGMTFSIEPGIYLQGEFGVRVEDIVLVTKDGCEVLNKCPKEFRII